MFSANPTAFETSCLLDRPCERLFRGDAEGNLVDPLGGGAETAQDAVQVFPHGTPPDTEPIQHRERNPVALLEHREEEMFRIYRAMTAPVRLFVRRPNDSARCLREAVEHAARLLGPRRYVKCLNGALAVHPDRDVAHAEPGVEPGTESPERAIVGGRRVLGEADRRSEEPAALSVIARRHRHFPFGPRGSTVWGGNQSGRSLICK